MSASRATSAPSIARGLAVIAVGAASTLVATGWPRPDTRTPRDACSAAVELVDDRGNILACADAGWQRRCGGVQVGDRLYLEGGVCRVSPGGMAANVRLVAGVPLDLNRASAVDLTRLKGIGPKRAAAIVAHREREGPFPSVDALQAIKGVGPKTVTRLRPWLTVRGSSGLPSSEAVRGLGSNTAVQ